MFKSFLTSQHTTLLSASVLLPSNDSEWTEQCIVTRQTPVVLKDIEWINIQYDHSFEVDNMDNIQVFEHSLRNKKICQFSKSYHVLLFIVYMMSKLLVLRC